MCGLFIPRYPFSELSTFAESMTLQAFLSFVVLSFVYNPLKPKQLALLLHQQLQPQLRQLVPAQLTLQGHSLQQQHYLLSQRGFRPRHFQYRLGHRLRLNLIALVLSFTTSPHNVSPATTPPLPNPTRFITPRTGRTATPGAAITPTPHPPTAIAAAFTGFSSAMVMTLARAAILGVGFFDVSSVNEDDRSYTIMCDRIRAIEMVGCDYDVAEIKLSLSGNSRQGVARIWELLAKLNMKRIVA
jgi:hypothetical protein